MEITEVRIKLMSGGEDRLRGFCSVTFDHSFVIRDLKIIEGSTGLFIAMPSRKLTFHCFRCRQKNHLRSRYCNHCGIKLPPTRVDTGPDGRGKLYADVAHPINVECREQIQRSIVEEYYAEVELSKQPGYRSRYDDDYETGLDHPVQSPDQQVRIDEPARNHSVATPHLGNHPSELPHRIAVPEESAAVHSNTIQPASGDDPGGESPGDGQPVG